MLVELIRKTFGPSRQFLSQVSIKNGLQGLSVANLLEAGRLTRRTNAFSKKVENHAHAVAIHFMYFNFVRIHTTLRVTPAMAAGVTDRLWELEDIVKLTDQPT